MNQISALLRAAVVSIVFAAVSTTALATPSVAEPSTRSATNAVEADSNRSTPLVAVCGFYENNIRAYYNHCGPTHVVIKIDGRPSYLWCIGPGTWDIGRAADVDNAYYVGRTC